MILGRVTSDGVPEFILSVAGRDWTAVIDTGFNGDLELPAALQEKLDCVYFGPTLTELAAGQLIEEETYIVQFAFDGTTVKAEATFVPSGEILIGTRLMRRHRLTIDFPAATVLIERTDA